LRRSGSAVCQRRLHGRAGLEGSEDLHGCDRGAGEFRRDIAGDGGEAENLDEERCPGIAGRLEILPRIARQPELELSARHRLTDCVVLPFELVSNGCADEISTVGVEPVANHEVHASEIDKAQVHRNFFAVGRLWSQLVNLSRRLSISLDGLQLVGGWVNYKGRAKNSRRLARAGRERRLTLLLWGQARLVCLRGVGTIGTGMFRKRPIAMMCNALLAARSPPRLSRCLTVLPDDAGTGLTPHSDAKLASERNLSGLSPAVRRSWAAPVWPIELRATGFGASSSTMAAIIASRSAISSCSSGRSTVIRTLAVRDEWFLDSVPFNLDPQKVIERLSGKWILEAAELSGIKKADVEHYKQFLSSPGESARPAYGRKKLEAPRQCVFIGTTNEEHYLRDETGNRRNWGVKLNGAFDIEALKRDRDQLWAEASFREAAGESIRLDESLWPATAKEQNQRMVADPFDDVLEHALGYLDGKISSLSVLTILNIPEGQRTPTLDMRAANAMKRLGWERPGNAIWVDGKTARGYLRGDPPHKLITVRRSSTPA
jgi:Virulence-associated protein E